MLSVWGVLVHENNQQDAHLFISLVLSLTCLEQVIVHYQKKFCTSSLQNFTTHLMRNLVADMIIRNIPATEHKLLRRVCILLVWLMCITMHGAENVKGVFNCAVCLTAVCVVKKLYTALDYRMCAMAAVKVRSLLQCYDCGPGMIRIQSGGNLQQSSFWQYILFVPVMVFLHEQYCVTYSLCQFAVSINILYRSCCPVPPAPQLYPMLSECSLQKVLQMTVHKNVNRAGQAAAHV
jgi:hypothetical protein